MRVGGGSVGYLPVSTSQGYQDVSSLESSLGSIPEKVVYHFLTATMQRSHFCRRIVPHFRHRRLQPCCFNCQMNSYSAAFVSRCAFVRSCQTPTTICASSCSSWRRRTVCDLSLLMCGRPAGLLDQEAELRGKYYVSTLVLTDYVWSFIDWTLLAFLYTNFDKLHTVSV